MTTVSWPPQQLSSISTRRYREPLVLLHGWGCDSRSWQPLVTALNQHLDIILVDLPGFGLSPLCHSVQDFIVELAKLLPERFIVMGWSLGGMLATQLAATYPQRVMGLITLASNPKFVSDESWPHAMARSDFDAFVSGFEGSASQTLKRFCGLVAMGDTDRALQKTLRADAQSSWDSAAGTEPERSWVSALQWLDTIDNRECFKTLANPGLHFFAVDDGLVPSEVTTDLASLNHSQKVRLLENTCHALHWSLPEVISAQVSEFVDAVHYSVDKKKVAESFGRAAPKYDSVAQIQRQIGHHLLSLIEAPERGTKDDQMWLDLGCGTGYFTPHLSEQLGCDGSSVVGLDLAQGMLSFARDQRRNGHHWVCADAENIALKTDSMDGVFSSLAIQWCANLDQLFAELARVVMPGGRIFLATLGPRTLTELRQSWSAVDSYTHVNHFASESALRQAIECSGLKVAQWQCEDIVLRYDQVRELTYELKTLGAHNMNHGQSSGLTGRQRITAFKQAYEIFRQTDGKLPATYEVFYMELVR